MPCPLLDMQSTDRTQVGLPERSTVVSPIAGVSSAFAHAGETSFQRFISSLRSVSGTPSRAASAVHAVIGAAPPRPPPRPAGAPPPGAPGAAPPGAPAGAPGAAAGAVPLPGAPAGPPPRAPCWRMNHSGSPFAAGPLVGRL